MLYYTSLLFGVVACFTKDSWIQPCMIALMGLSVINHAKVFDSYPGKRLVVYTDRALAHSIGLVSLIKSREIYKNALTIYTPEGLMLSVYCPLAVYYLSTGWCAYTYYAKTVWMTHDMRGHDFWHGSVHACASLGIYALYIAEKACKFALSYQKKAAM